MIRSLYLRNFRNLQECELTFSPGLNLILGENAQGKTNLLEAITLVSTGRSFRAEKLSELIRSGASFFFLEAIVQKPSGEHKVQISFEGEAKKLQLDGNAYTTLQHLLGLAPSVLHTPGDQALVDGTPQARRRFLNLHLAQRDPVYIHHLSRYWRAMKQRNALLRSNDPSAIECWEVEMASSAVYLSAKRREFGVELAPRLKAKGLQLSLGKEVHELRLHSSGAQTAEGFAEQLKRHRPREQQLGLTLTGPHREDFELLINEKPASAFASEGQKRTAAAALRFAEWETLSEATGAPAVFGLDDIGPHLDEARQQCLAEATGSLAQVFLTATGVPNGWKEPEGARRFSVADGVVLA